MASGCRVLVLNERDPAHPSAGGAEIHLAEIFGRLAARGYEITLAASRFPGAAAREHLHGLEVRRLGRLPAYYPRVAWTTARETRRGRYDVVVECLNKLPFYAPLYSAAPVLALCHHLFGEVAFQQVAWPVAATVWAAERLIPPLYRSLPFVAISPSSRDDLIARGIPAERIRVIHCGTRRPDLAIDTDKPRPLRVAYLGRLEPYKRVDVMLRALARLRQRFPDLEVLVIGRGSAREGLERLARELDLDVRFVGFVPDEQRDALLASTRVCVCPSLKEGWGLSVIESNAAGVPVVASDAPGLRDSVRHGETGFLVAEADLDGFALRIARLLSDDELAVRMSRAARAFSERFDWDDAAGEMAEALEEARRISDATAPRPGRPSAARFTGERLHADDELFRADLARHRAAYRFAIPHCDGGRVLDLGCGAGYGAAELAEAARLVVGVDRISPDAASRRDATRYVRADIEQPPLTAAAFDLVVSFQVIEHLTDPTAYLAGIGRLLHPDGLALFTTPNRLTSDGENPFHVHEYSSDELRECLRGHFREVEMAGVGASVAAASYLEERRRRIRRIVRLDPLQLRRRLPRPLARWLFGRFALSIRRGIQSSDGLPEISVRDFPIGPADPACVDLLAICRGPRNVKSTPSSGPSPFVDPRRTGSTPPVDSGPRAPNLQHS